MAGEILRLFFAVPLAEPLRDAACALQERLAETCRGGPRVKWVERDNLHLTLKFVGDTSAKDLGRLTTTAERIAAECSPATVRLQGVGRFPPRGAPRVIWLGLAAESPELTRLAERLDRALQAEGLAEAERNPFTAHFTLGRVKDRHDNELSGAIRRLAAEPIGKMTVDHFCLMSSDLTPKGPVYAERARFELTA